MAGTKNSGRKPKSVEVHITEFYTALMPEAFEFAQTMLRSKNKKDKLWAMDWLKTGLVKMIPQVNKIGGDPDNQTPIPIYSAKSVKK